MFRNLTLTVLGIVLFAQFAVAQKIGEQDEYQKSSLFGIKLLFLDYQLLNQGDDLQATNGIELSFHRELGRQFAIGLPLKIGSARYVNELNNMSFVGLDGIFSFRLSSDTSRILPYLLAGAGAVIETAGSSNFQIPLGAGLNYQVGDQSFINIQAEYRTSLADERNNLQLGLGYIYRFKKIDSDGDDVVDFLDKCPNVPGVVALDGCPDKDRDGVTDARDLCPDVPGRRATDGCPDKDRDGITDADDPCPEVAGNFGGCPDSDRDGVGDGQDRCPDQPGIIIMQGCPDMDGDGVADLDDQCPKRAGTIANQGCPVFDTDKDGVPDDVDLCPNDKGSKVANGCPDADRDGVADKDDRCPDKAGPFAGCPDTDKDGVIDADDACPDQPGIATNKGCPELEEEEKKVLEFAMQAVQFETGKATLRPGSAEVLDQIILILRKYPGYKLKISGHTDNVGDPTFNQQLSEYRALTCYDYMLSQGILADRLSYTGYGQSRPRATNGTNEGRRLNRRVEFELFPE